MKDEMYDKISKLLTDFENQEDPADPKVNWESEFYYLLAEIQNNWDDMVWSDYDYNRGYNDCLRDRGLD